jgi:hypothetical protein
MMREIDSPRFARPVDEHVLRLDFANFLPNQREQEFVDEEPLRSLRYSGAVFLVVLRQNHRLHTNTSVAKICRGPSY